MDKVDPSCREKLLKELSNLPAPLLQRLMDDGVTFSTVDNKMSDGKKDGGCFRSLSREIALDKESFQTERGRAVLTHEIGHAVDYGKVPGAKTLKEHLSAAFFDKSKNKLSESSPELNQLYQNFQAKAVVDFSGTARSEVNKNLEPGEDKLVGKNLSTAMYKNTVFIHQPGTQDDLMVVQHKTNRFRNGLIKLGVAAAAGVGAVLTGGIAGALIGSLALSSGTFGVKDLLSKPKEWEQKVGDVQVRQTEDNTAVIIPKTAPDQKIDWTVNQDYIATSNRKEELFADGVSAYLTSPESRDKLQKEEPELYKLIQSSLDEYMLAPKPGG